MKTTAVNQLPALLILLIIAALPLQAQVTAYFTAAPLSGCAPLRVEFTNQSVNSIEWDWDFGDGETSFLQNPVHYYTQPGTYSVTLTAYGAGGSDTITKTNLVTVTGFEIEVSVTDASCGQANGSIDVTVNSSAPPVTYSWSNGATSQDMSSLAAGSYRVTVSDGSGCVFTETYHVETSGNITITGTVQHVLPGVHNGSIQLSVSGGSAPYSYSWSNGETGSIVDGLSAGTYCVTVSDANGCSADKCFLIETAQGCNLTITGSVHDATAGAANGSIEPFVSGGTQPYSYSWSNGETGRIIDGLPTGTYCLTVTDANGCLGDKCFVVEIAQANCSTLAIAGSVTDASAPGESDGAIALNISGGTSPYTYAWSNGATTKNIDNLTNGQYCVIVTDVNGCTRDKCFVVEVANACGNFSVIAQITNASCGASNGSINLIVSGGTQPYFYAWASGSNDEDRYNLVAGNYRVTVEDNAGCRFTETFTVGSNANNISITGTVTNLSAPGAQDGAIHVTVSGGTPPYTYYWTHGATTEDLSALEAGRYCILVTDANGCAADECFDVEVSGGGCGDFNITGNVGNVPCGGSIGYINITVQFGTPPYYYNWSNGATTEDLLSVAPGTYTVTVEDSGPCRKVHTFTVGYSGGFQITGTVLPSTAGTATGGIAIYTSGGAAPFTFQWSNGVTTQNNYYLTPGQYCVIVTDANGCVEDMCFVVGTTGGCGSFYVTAHNDIYLCEPGTVWLEANAYEGEPLYSYTWTPASGLSSPYDRITQATVSDTTTFTITATDDNGCTATDEVTVFVTSLGAGSVGVAFDSVTICRGDSVQLAAFGGNDYYWDPGNGLSDRYSPTPWAAPEETKNYVVIISNGGCESMFTVHVEVDDDCVWPGDANHDGIANNQDVLALGIGNGISGFPRPNATNNWNAQYCPDWFLALASGPNLKHLDCDGNGTINAADTIPLFLNYGMTHNRSGSPGQKFVDPELYFDLPTDTAFAGQEIDVPVYLGTSNIQTSNFYGIAFSVNYDNTIVEENTMHFEAVNSFAGNANDLLSFDFDMYGDSKMDVALTRLNRTVASGFGQIGTISFAMKDDISGKNFLVRELTLSFSDVRAIDNNENDLLLFYEAGSLFVKQELSGLAPIHNVRLNIYPNPASEIITVEMKDENTLREVALLDLVGKEITKTQGTGNRISLETGNLPEGNYLLKVKTAEGEAVRKITVLR